MIRAAAPDKACLTCHDEYLLPSMVQGVDGALVGFASVIPGFIHDLLQAVKAGDLTRAGDPGAHRSAEGCRLWCRRADRRSARQHESRHGRRRHFKSGAMRPPTITPKRGRNEKDRSRGQKCRRDRICRRRAGRGISATLAISDKRMMRRRDLIKAPQAPPPSGARRTGRRAGRVAGKGQNREGDRAVAAGRGERCAGPHRRRKAFATNSALTVVVENQSGGSGLIGTKAGHCRRSRRLYVARQRVQHRRHAAGAQGRRLRSGNRSGSRGAAPPSRRLSAS